MFDLKLFVFHCDIYVILSSGSCLLLPTIQANLTTSLTEENGLNRQGWITEVIVYFKDLHYTL